MPVLDGHETRRMLRNDPETRHIHVIFLITSDAQSGRLWAKMQGVKDLMGNPYKDGQILDKINVHEE